MPASTCAQCGQPLPSDGRFCTRCGASFVPAPAHAPAQAAAPAPPPPSVRSAPPSPEARALLSATIFDTSPVHAPPASAQATMFGYSAASVAMAKAAQAAVASQAASSPPVAAVTAAPIAPAPIIAASAAPASGAPVQPGGATPPPPSSQSALAPPPSSRAPAAAAPTFKQTMIGVISLPPGLAASGAPPAMTAAPAPAPLPQPVPSPAGLSHAPMAVPNTKGTMLGVAIPGIAPLSASAPPPNVAATRGPSSTMLGVALPGIAPVQGPLPGAGASYPPRGVVASKPPPVVLPRPAPLVDDEPAIGPAPRLDRKGVPLTYVAGGVFGIVLVVGVAVALLWKGQSLVVVPRLDAQGHEQLHLTCESCPDGTVASIDGAQATFQSKEADLGLTTPLQVGDNPMSIRLARPRLGRSEDVKVVVPIAFRIKADLAQLAGAHPTVLVRVEAVPGTTVRVDDKPVTLDAHGAGVYAVDVGAQASGWADDVRRIDLAIPYAITPAAADPASRPAEQTGRLAVRAGIAPLHLDSPGLSAVVDGASFRVAGRTSKGATMTLNGQPVQVDADGSFAQAYDAATPGDIPVEVRADLPQLASRTAHFAVKRVVRLADEARRRERGVWLGYDSIVSAGDGATGKDTVVEGDVVESRASGGQVVALVDDARGCGKAAGAAAAPCLVRVVASADAGLDHGTHVRVYGKVTGVVAGVATGAAGKPDAPVPAVQADFVMKGRATDR